MGMIQIRLWCSYGKRTPEEKKWLDPLIEEYVRIYVKSNKIMKKADAYEAKGDYLKTIEYRNRCFQIFDRSFSILDTIRERFPELRPDDSSNELLLFFRSKHDFDRVNDIDRHMLIEVCRSLREEAKSMGIELTGLAKAMHEASLNDSVIIEDKRLGDTEAYDADIMFLTITKIIDYLERWKKYKDDKQFPAMRKYNL